MLITNIIGLQNHPFVHEIIDYYTIFSDVVCYTDCNTKIDGVNLATEFDISIAMLKEDPPHLHACYQIAWDHVERIQPNEYDWILQVTSEELLCNVEDLKGFLDGELSPVLMPILSLFDDVITNQTPYQPRLFPYRYGGNTFDNDFVLWPEYVNFMARRRSLQQENMYIKTIMEL